MFHQEFLRRKTLKNKLFDLMYLKEVEMNRGIHVRDIVVYPEDIQEDAYGEHSSGSNQYTHIPFLERLIDNIKILTKTANAYHQKYYCEKNEDGNHYIKPDCLDKITRLSTHEFFFYSKQPLTQDDLIIFIEEIYTLAKEQQDNVHLLLSSFSLATDDGKILNLSFYVQCGNNPKIETICKARAYVNDKRPESSDKGYPEKGINFIQHESPDIISPYICSEKGKNISNNTIFFVETASGARYVQAIDVCLDHVYSHSKNLFEKLLDTDVSLNPVIIPFQVDHIVSSNFTDILKEAKISKSILHVDPRHKDGEKMKRDIMRECDLEEIFEDDKYNNINFYKLMGGGFAVKRPPFGGDYYFYIMKERKMRGFNDTLRFRVADRNDDTAEYIINNIIDNKKTLIDTSVNIDNINKQNLQIIKSPVDNRFNDLCKQVINTRNDINITKRFRI